MAKELSGAVLVVLLVGLSGAATIEQEIWVSPEEPYIYEFSVEKTGTIYAEAALEVEEPVLILELLSAGVKKMIRGNSGELLTLEYIVSDTDLESGNNWKISVESGKGAGRGRLKVDYPGMTPPTAIISAIPTEINEGESVSFSAEASSDLDGYIISYAWDFGDGAVDEGINVEHVYTHSGQYIAMLTVKDNDGLSHSSRVEITAYRSNMPPTAYINIYPNPAAEGEEITFEGYGDDEDGEVVEYRWTFPDERTFLDFGSSSYFTLESGEVQAGWYSFAVRDDNGAWSDEARVELELETLPAIPWMWIVTAMVLVIAVPLLIRLKKHSHPKIEIEIRGGIEMQQHMIDLEVRGGIERLQEEE